MMKAFFFILLVFLFLFCGVQGDFGPLTGGVIFLDHTVEVEACDFCSHETGSAPLIPDEDFLSHNFTCSTLDEAENGVIDDVIPEGTFSDQLAQLSNELRQTVLKRIEELQVHDFESVRTDPDGMIYFVCSQRDQGLPIFSATECEEITASNSEKMPELLISVDFPPLLHSRPGAPRVLYLDFNGHLLSGTAWNENPAFGLVSSWNCRPYSSDWDESTFNAVEQQAIRQIWERVAEDYSPFNVDVTTEEPAEWNSEIGHALITPGYDADGQVCPHNGYGGIAYVNVFGTYRYSHDQEKSYSPVWIAEMSVSAIADTISHEFGHNLGLSHDGTETKAYYNGHEGDSISWAPLMGTGCGRNLTQWSRGDYYAANQKQDDLSIISARLGYRPDDHGDSAATATPLLHGTFSAEGVIERSRETDVFSFVSPGGQVEISANPYRAGSETWGGNLDIQMDIYNGSGILILSENPPLEAGVALSTTLPAGRYYIYIRPAAAGAPEAIEPTGYVEYGSLGQYSLSAVMEEDGDFDGLQDAWEVACFSSADADADTDSDFDGANNYAEYIAGTDPMDAASGLRAELAPMPVGGEGMLILWNSTPGRVYSVSWTKSLSDGNFELISEEMSWPQNCFTDRMDRAENCGFYRINVRLE